ncbi:hypothetical protein I7X12_05710 [Halosimplex litoreum]|uniref:Uncharacterized protein n=1 Tax=Halosimplex litoreum TaxID=1198301 RepID=A0A7T3G0I0_9EURY|nr:hypothetical protein [Halosimplex litoreum]QPV64120.1 hypothetical protein I7X12_05710 [Halosimplex litoreum]
MGEERGKRERPSRERRRQVDAPLSSTASHRSSGRDRDRRPYASELLAGLVAVGAFAGISVVIGFYGALGLFFLCTSAVLGYANRAASTSRERRGVAYAFLFLVVGLDHLGAITVL